MLQEDATLEALKIENGIIAKGFTGSFEGYSSDGFEHAVKQL